MGNVLNLLHPSWSQNTHRHTIPQEYYLEVAQSFHWARKEHYQLWFTGSLKRHKRTEVMLPRLVAKDKLRACRYQGHMVYSAPRRVKNQDIHFAKIEHGLACTECLVRIYRDRMDCKVISEKEFTGFGIRPEWGIHYPDGKLLLFEFCTQDNFLRSGLIKNKMTRYSEHLEGIVLFVVDVERAELEKFIRKNLPLGMQFFFCDYQSFLAVPFGNQLEASIYLWGGNAEIYPMTKNAGF